MSALILPVVDADTTPEDIKLALIGLACDAARMPTRDGLSRLNAEHERLHRAIDGLLDELVGR